MSGAVPRVLALLAAIGMVLGALAIRNRMDDDDDRGGGRGGGDLRLTCTPELERVCNGIAADPRVELTIEDAGRTFDRLLTADGPVPDGWLTPGPWSQMLEEVRRSEGRRSLLRVGRPVAWSPVAVVVWRERAGPLAPHCPNRIVHMHCLGIVAGQPWSKFSGQPTWGDIKPALPDALTSATGLAALGAGTAAFFGKSDVSSDELQNNDGFAVWLQALARINRPLDLELMLAQGPSSADALASLEAGASFVIKGSAHEGRVTLSYSAPVVTADVVLGTAAGERGERLAELVRSATTREAFEMSGWKVANRPSSTGLPSPGLLYALREAWRDAAR